MKIKIFLIVSCIACIFFPTDSWSQESTFTNPILPSGADPYCTYYNGYYYYTNTIGGGRIILKKTKSLANLEEAETRVIWRPPSSTMHSMHLWAPEVHHIDGKWYAYYAADDGDNNNHRMYVIENTSDDPFTGEWKFKGKLSTPSDKWAIDGNVFELDGQLYMIWSGWEGDHNGRQDIYIAKMKNPYTMEGERVKISSPTLEWEKNWKGGPKVYVNEGPQFLQHGKDVFIIFSASGCWTDHYTLGLLKLQGQDLLNPEHWNKYPEPLFSSSAKNSVYSPGHNSFFKSPDGTEDWILYHANDNPGDGCGGKRSPRMQKISWDINGNPDFGIPVSVKEKLLVPSEKK